MNVPAFKLLSDRRQLSWVAMLALAAACVSAGPARAALTLTQFQGAGLGSSGYVPPDMGGSVGDGYVVQMLNGVSSIYSYTGTLDSRQTLSTFWSGVSGAIGGTSISDPRVIYDPGSGLWFASAISTQSTNNNILIAVSKTSNPTAGFNEFSIASASGTFADFPTLAVNGAAVTIGTNNFTGSTGSYSASSVYSIPKASLTAATPSLGSITRFDNASSVGSAPEAVTNASGTGTSTSIVSTSGGAYTLSTVTGANAAGATLSQTQQYTQPLLNNALLAPTQPGGTTYDAGDNRISSGAYQSGNNIYFVNTVSNGTADVIAWVILNATNDSVVANGYLTMPGLNLTYPSISANADGTFVIAFNGSGAANNIGDYYAVCSVATSQCGTPQASFISPASNYSNAPAGTNRWGDYSWTTVDPTNPSTFWLFQEYAATNSSWGTVITSISTASAIAAPEPAGLMLLVAGLGGLGLVRTRPRRR